MVAGGVINFAAGAIAEPSLSCLALPVSPILLSFTRPLEGSYNSLATKSKLGAYDFVVTRFKGDYASILLPT
jgi:hypothetical protein